jgi:hypothetical protein
MYHSNPKTIANNSNAILYITDIYGVPLLQNKLYALPFLCVLIAMRKLTNIASLADSLAHGTGFPVIMPDLFAGDAIPVSSSEGGLNLTEWYVSVQVFLPSLLHHNNKHEALIRGSTIFRRTAHLLSFLPLLSFFLSLLTILIRRIYPGAPVTHPPQSTP